DTVGGSRDVVLDQRPTLDHRDLGGLGLNVDGHEVAADRLALALPSAALAEGLLVQVDRLVVGDRGDRRATGFGARSPALRSGLLLPLVAALAASLTAAVSPPVST